MDKEVLTLYAKGYTMRDIGTKVYRGYETIKSRFTRMRERNNIDNNRLLLSMAIQKKLIKV